MFLRLAHWTVGRVALTNFFEVIFRMRYWAPHVKSSANSASPLPWDASKEQSHQLTRLYACITWHISSWTNRFRKKKPTNDAAAEKWKHKYPKVSVQSSFPRPRKKYKVRPGVIWKVLWRLEAKTFVPPPYRDVLCLSFVHTIQCYKETKDTRC